MYGVSVRAFEVTELSTSGYAERPAGRDPLLTGSGAGWNAGGMHHLDPLVDAGGVLAAVDGWRRWTEASVSDPITSAGWACPAAAWKTCVLGREARLGSMGIRDAPCGEFARWPAQEQSRPWTVVFEGTWRGTCVADVSA